jgi:MoaA/NifB/PqqE/SkfB family radical SAM enzyme
VHCNVSASSEKRRETLSIDFWIDLLEQCERADVLKLTVTGGEPFIREGWTEFLEALSRRRLGAVILSNGSRISDHDMELMAKSSITLSISLDGTEAGQHDLFRQTAGAFASTVETMRRMRQHGVRFVISTVIHDANVETVDRIIDLGVELGAFRVIVVPMVAVGRAALKAHKGHFPKSDALEAALGRIRHRAMNSPGPEIIVGNSDTKESVTIGDRYSGATAMSKRNPGLCKAGVYSMAVDEDGQVYSCLRGVQTKTFPIGDLKAESLNSVWTARRWASFRDVTIPRVPCRVEHIGKHLPLYLG